jgi:hypothetical protein
VIAMIVDGPVREYDIRFLALEQVLEPGVVTAIHHCVAIALRCE